MARVKRKKPDLTESFRKHITSTGYELTVRRVSQPIVGGVLPERPKPKHPTIKVPILDGKDVQERPLKKGDDGWDEYQADLEAWEEEKNDLQDAVSLVLSVGRDIQITEEYNLLMVTIDELKFTEETQLLIDTGLLPLPDNIWLAKEMWLYDHYIGQHDKMELNWIQMELNGTPREVVDNIKASFRDIISGEKSGQLGSGDEQAETVQGDDQV